MSSAYGPVGAGADVGARPAVTAAPAGTGEDVIATTHATIALRTVELFGMATPESFETPPKVRSRYDLS
jgi:hypothetical protein